MVGEKGDDADIFSSIWWLMVTVTIDFNCVILAIKR